MWYEQTDAGIYIHLKVVPRSSRAKVGPVEGERIKVRVTSPPVDGEANAAIVKLLSKKLGVPRSRIDIVRGETSRNKTVLVRGVSMAQVEELAHE